MSELRPWFQVNDLNSDPQIWELTETFGDRSLRIWLEILARAYNTGGTIKSTTEHYATIIAPVCRVTSKTARGVLTWLTTHGWIVGESPIWINYRKFPELNPALFTSIPTALKTTIFTKHDGLCFYCKRPATSLDHILPVIRGGGHHEQNLVPACRSCNSLKGTMLPYEWYPDVYSVCLTSPCSALHVIDGGFHLQGRA